MKKWIFLILAGFLILGAAGCNGGEGQQERNLQEGERILGGVENTPDPETVSAWAEEVKEQQGAYMEKFDGQRVLLIAMGEQRTGGYDVEIKDAGLDKQGRWVIVAAFNEPAEDAMVTEALTYPLEVLTLPKDEKEVAVYLVKGEGQEDYERMEIMTD